MDCSTPGLPVHHQLWESTQTHVDHVGDAIQLSLPVIPFSCLQSFPASGSFPMNQFFESGAQSIKSFSFSISPSNEHSGLISFRMDWLDLLVVQGTLKSLLQHHSLKASILRCSAFFMLETRVWYLGREDCLEKEMAIHSSTLAWKIPWIEPGRLQSMESQRVGHDWATLLTYSFLYSPTLTSIHEHGKTLTVLQTLASQCFGLLSISQTNLVGLHGGHGKSLVWDLLSFRGLWNIQVVSGR